MKYDTQMIAIGVDPAKVVRFVADGTNLPRWAIGFAAAVEPIDGAWEVTTGSGDRIRTRIVNGEAADTVDFVMSPSPGVSVTAWTRCLPSHSGTVFTFTQVQGPGVPDDVFDGQVKALHHELAALKAILEVECPL